MLEALELALDPLLFSTFSRVIILLFRLPISVFFMAIGCDVSFSLMVLGTDMDYSTEFCRSIISSVGSRIYGSSPAEFYVASTGRLSCCLAFSASRSRAPISIFFEPDE